MSGFANKRSVICLECKRAKVYFAKGLCEKCYARVWQRGRKRRIVECVSCQKPGRHVARGLCQSCYQRDHAKDIGIVNYRIALPQEDLAQVKSIAHDSKNSIQETLRMLMTWGIEAWENQ